MKYCIFIAATLICLYGITGCGGGSSAPDSIAPIITLNGSSVIDIKLFDSYEELGATAEDDVDGNVTVTITADIDISTLGEHSVRYQAKDAAGNTAEVFRTVNVVGFRTPNLTCKPPEPIPAAPGVIDFEVKYPELPALSSPMAMVQPKSDSSLWLIALRGGRIVKIGSEADSQQLTTILDISDKVGTNYELGFTGLAFHPNYPQDNRIFAVYNDLTESNRSTVSSFRINISTHQIDASSENVFFTVPQDANNHNGGDIAFGIDNYLYVSFGDGGADRSESQNTSNLLGSMVRIDVTNDNYSIPDDNPFSQNQSLCLDGVQKDGKICPEIFAYGFRNPWRWSVDRLTGEIWVADVGESTFEEVNKLESGGNYGWPIMEANQCFNNQNCDKSGLKLPITQYPRDVGVSGVGGYVYRGSEYPSMYGLYLWGDTYSGQFLSIPASAEVGIEPTLIFSFEGRGYIAAMAEGNDGNIYMLSLYGGQGDNIFKIGSTDGTPLVTMPDLLSDTGCFETQTKSFVEGVFAYEVNSALWSDGAEKTRGFALPEDKNLSVLADGDFDFPVDSILIKNFWHNEILLETRLLVNHDDGWLGYSYEWNDSQTDALLLRTGQTKQIGDFVHTFPSPSQCAMCHTAAANTSLGIESGQLNLTHTELNNNQIDFISTGQFLDTQIVSDSAPKLYSITDSSASVAQKARSYLHANCSGCHRPSAPGEFIDLRFDTTLEDTQTCNVSPSMGDLGATNAKIIAPGRANDSVLLLRMQAIDNLRMPPLASAKIDKDATDIISQWINNLKDCN